jgi:GNAT superfamily N-acetyltransferase
MSECYTLRLATLDDVPTILHQRRAMFAEMGSGTDEQLDAMTSAFAPWVREKIAQGRYRGWLVLDTSGAIVGGAGLWLMEWPPTVLEPNPLRAYMLNVYTEPAHRRHGIAHLLTEAIIDWCRANAYHLLVLHASDAGRPVYESLGFRLSNEMRLVL